MELMKPNTSFFAKIRQKFLDWWVNREIFNGIFPHLEKEYDHGYPFDSDEEFWRAADKAHRDATSLLDLIEKQTRSMPKAYSEGFRYTAYTQLGKQMRAYLQIGKRRVQPKTCDSRFVATHA